MVIGIKTALDYQPLLKTNPMRFPRKPPFRVKSVVQPDTVEQGPYTALPVGRLFGPVKKPRRSKSRKTYSAKQIFEINTSRYWEQKWQTMQDQMYMALSKNRCKAWEKMRERHIRLRDHVVQWPETMTTKEIRERVIAMVPLPEDPLAKTMLKRLTRLNFVAFDQHTRLWLNLCHLPKEQ